MKEPTDVYAYAYPSLDAAATPYERAYREACIHGEASVMRLVDPDTGQGIVAVIDPDRVLRERVAWGDDAVEYELDEAQTAVLMRRRELATRHGLIEGHYEGGMQLEQDGRLTPTTEVHDGTD